MEPFQKSMLISYMRSDSEHFDQIICDILSDQKNMKEDIKDLKADVAILKQEMQEVKGMLQLIINHLGIASQ